MGKKIEAKIIADSICLATRLSSTEESKTMYIYKTTNILNGKIYIGKRVYRKKDDEWYLGSGVWLNRCIKKYGRTNFKKEIIEWCNDKDDLCKKEIHWINHFNSTNPVIGYNLSLGGEGGYVGAQAYIKISDKLKGRKKSKEFGLKVSRALKGKTKSKEHIEKVRQALLGRARSSQVIEKMSKSMKAKYDSGWKSSVEIQVNQYEKITGKYIKSFDSATQAGKILNIYRKGITNNCVGKSKSSGGFIWSKSKKENIYE